MRPARIVLHHSASPRTITAQQIDRWHRQRGWREIGYHFVVEEDGGIIRGRHPHDMGAAQRGANRDSLGICIVGDNRHTGERWTSTQLAALRKLIAAIHTVYGPLPVLGHRDVGSTPTECPGLDAEQDRRIMSWSVTAEV